MLAVFSRYIMSGCPLVLQGTSHPNRFKHCMHVTSFYYRQYILSVVLRHLNSAETMSCRFCLVLFFGGFRFPRWADLPDRSPIN